MRRHLRIFNILIFLSISLFLLSAQLVIAQEKIVWRLGGVHAVTSAETIGLKNLLNW